MKRVGNRSRALLILALFITAGLSFYIYRYFTSGAAWASFPSNQAIYSNGVLKAGTILDRNGVILSEISDGSRTYSDNPDIRKATLHAVGDLSGNIGTSALTSFVPQLIGYNSLTGIYTRAGGGKNLYLTIDARLNVAALKAMAGKKGAVGIMNYKTGEILCMVSTPAFDPLNTPDLEKSGGKYEGVFINRFLSSVYTPGSTFKLVTLAAAIENIPDLYDRVFTCEGGLHVGGDYVKCTKTHGRLSIEDALAVSCNSVFAELALELGADRLNAYAEKFGVTQSMRIDGIQTASGNYQKADAGTANLAWSGIGQYNDTVCPCAMLRYVGAIANGGDAVDMGLIHKTGVAGLIPAGSHKLVNKTTAENIATMMNYNVYKTYGQENFPGLELYAKSGTAEVGGSQPPHAWFAGYIANKDHPLAFVVVVENGGSGSHTAGTVANTVLQAAIGNKK